MICIDHTVVVRVRYIGRNKSTAITYLKQKEYIRSEIIERIKNTLKMRVYRAIYNYSTNNVPFVAYLFTDYKYPVLNVYNLRSVSIYLQAMD